MTTSEDGGLLKVNNNQEKAGAVMSASEDGGVLGVCDNRGEPIWSKP